MRASLSRVVLACGLLLTGPLAVRAQSAGGDNFVPLPPGPPPAGAASPALPNPAAILPGVPVDPAGQPDFNAPNGLPGTPVTAAPSNGAPNNGSANSGGPGFGAAGCSATRRKAV